ncbi:MAG: hypothetical protein M0C28_25445 [Candidatus Moduliflexus flocculans]|nr:hypothetical protein [Candidatus Moduliflexus flocculans]
MFTVKIWGDRGSMPTPARTPSSSAATPPASRSAAASGSSSSTPAPGIRQLGDSLMRDGPAQGADLARTSSSPTPTGTTSWASPCSRPSSCPGTKLRHPGPHQLRGRQPRAGLRRPALLPLLAGPPGGARPPRSATSRSRKTTFDLGDGICVTTKYLNHPILCLGYRFEYRGQGASCTAYDNEPFRNVFPTDPADPELRRGTPGEGEEAAREENEKILPLLSRGGPPGPRHPVHRQGVPRGQGRLGTLAPTSTPSTPPTSAGVKRAPPVPPRPEPDRRGAPGARDASTRPGSGAAPSMIGGDVPGGHPLHDRLPWSRDPACGATGR